MSFKAVFFDAAGTLFTSVRPIGQSYALFAKNYGMDVSERALAQRFRICHSSSPPLAFAGVEGDRLKELERNWWKELVRNVFSPFGPFEQFDNYFSDLFEFFSRSEAWSLFDDTRETLVTLRHRGFILSVISNFDSRLFGILDGLGIAHQFDSALISSQVGYAKPDAGIFQAALTRHKLSPEEALFVGDTPATDVAGARNAGIKGVLLDPRARQQGDFIRIQNLKGVLSLIDHKTQTE